MVWVTTGEWDQISGFLTTWTIICMKSCSDKPNDGIIRNPLVGL